MYVLSKTVLVATNSYSNDLLYNGYQFEVQCYVTHSPVCVLQKLKLLCWSFKALLVACLCFWPSYAVKLFIND